MRNPWDSEDQRGEKVRNSGPCHASGLPCWASVSPVPTLSLAGVGERSFLWTRTLRKSVLLPHPYPLSIQSRPGLGKLWDLETVLCF